MTPAAARGYRRRHLLLRSSGARSRNSVHRARPGVSVCDRKRRSLPFALRAPLVRLRIRRLDVAVRPFERGRWRDTRASCQRTLPNAGRCAAACVVHLVAETGSSRAVGRQPGRVCRACRPACAAVCGRARSLMCLSSIVRTAYIRSEGATSAVSLVGDARIRHHFEEIDDRRCRKLQAWELRVHASGRCRCASIATCDTTKPPARQGSTHGRTFRPHHRVAVVVEPWDGQDPPADST